MMRPLDISSVGMVANKMNLITMMRPLDISSVGVVANKMKPYLAMVLLQFGFAGMFIISVATLKRGMNHYVLVVYRNSVAVAVIAPFALWFDRKVRAKMTPLIFLKIMGLALLEIVLDQNFYYMGSKLTSASFAAAMVNILPAITFLMALVLRMEKVHIKRRHSQAKLAGTLVTVVGALIMILYKGPIVEFAWSNGRSQHVDTVSHDNGDWLKGTFLLLGSCVCWSGFFVLQSNTLKSYPSELSLTVLICLMGVVMSTAVALVAERGNAEPWSIGWDTRLFTAIYSGVVCSGVTYYVQGKVMKERGPVFVTAFSPLCMIIVAVLGSIILAEEITLGRVIGAVVIVGGLYCLIWGKSKDYLDSALAGCGKNALELPVATTSDVKSGLIPVAEEQP